MDGSDDDPRGGKGVKRRRSLLSLARGVGN